MDVWKWGTCILTSADTLAMAMPKKVGRKVGHRGPHAARVYWLGSSGQTGDGGRQGLTCPAIPVGPRNSTHAAAQSRNQGQPKIHHIL